MNIKVKLKNVYGTDLVYPVCDKAILFCKLIGTKTFTQSMIVQVKALGYTVEVVSDLVRL